MTEAIMHTQTIGQAAPATTAPVTPASGIPTPTRKLGTFSIAMMIVAASAPLTVIAGGAPSSFAVSGITSVPAAYLVLAAVLALFAFGYAAMARHITNPGAFYAYVARGLGRPLGVASAIGAMVSYLAMEFGIFGMFGFTVADWLTVRFGLETSWWMWALAGVLIVGVLGMWRIDFSARVIAVLVALEFLAVGVVDAVGLGAAPEGYPLDAINPASLITPEVGVLLAFGVAAFMGFESAAIYAHEAKNPRTTIGRATFLAVIGVGLFYSISAWALTVGVGPSQVVAQSEELGPGIVFALIGAHLPEVVVDIVNALFITSLFAALLSFHNAVSRYIAELGRERVAPQVFAKRTENGAPIVGSLTQTVLSIIVTLGFVLGDPGDPLYPVLTMFTWLTNTGAFGLVLLMCFVAVAIIAFFIRDDRGVGAWSRLFAPAIAAMALGAVFILVLVNFPLMLGQEEADLLTWILPSLVIVPGALGFAWGSCLRSARPEAYAGIAADMDAPTGVIPIVHPAPGADRAPFMADAHEPAPGAPATRR
mgnify:CR=1 FL=1